MKKIIILFLSFNMFLYSDMYSDWNIQNLGTMVVFVKYSKSKLGMLTIGVSDFSNNIQINSINISGNTIIEIIYPDENKILYDVTEYTNVYSIILYNNEANSILDKLIGASKIRIWCDNDIVEEFLLDNLTDLLNEYN